MRVHSLTDLLEENPPDAGCADDRIRGAVERLQATTERVPLVKFDNVTLVAWRLEDARGRQLAAQKRVRLRRLLQFRSPSRAAKKKSERHDQGSFRFEDLGLENIDVQLALGGPVELPLAGGVLQLGMGGRAVESLEVRGGAVRWHVVGDPQAGKLDVRLRGLDAALRALKLGTTSVDAQVEVPGVAAHVELIDLKPRRLVAAAGQLRLHGVEVRTAPPAPRSDS